MLLGGQGTTGEFTDKQLQLSWTVKQPVPLFRGTTSTKQGRSYRNNTTQPVLLNIVFM